jgi:hypothetical protein
VSEDFENFEDDDTPDQIILRASAGKWVWVLIGSLVFAMFGGGIALSAKTGVVAKGLGWFLVVLFGLCVVVALRELRAPGSLTISRRAIEVISRGRLTSFALADCSRFSAWRNPSRGNVVVVFDYSADGDTDLARMNRQLMGGSRSLMDGYGLSTESLVDLLNQARAAGLSDGAVEE